jgi:hypothetical protein
LNRPEEAIAVVPNAIEGSSQPKTYVGLQARPPKNEDDPGEIMEAWFYVENGKVVLTDGTHQQLARQRLSEGQDPADWRGNFLRDKAVGPDFNRALEYPNLD